MATNLTFAYQLPDGAALVQKEQQPSLVTSYDGRSDTPTTNGSSQMRFLNNSPTINIEDVSDDAISNSGNVYNLGIQGYDTSPSTGTHSPVNPEPDYLMPFHSRPRLLSISSDVVDAGHRDWNKCRRPSCQDPYVDNLLLSTTALQESLGPVQECGLVDWLAQAEKISNGISGNGTDQNYVPIEQLDTIMTEKNVSEELRRIIKGGIKPVDVDEGNVKQWAARICRNTTIKRYGKPAVQSFRRVFAVLVYVNKAHDIVHFINDDIGDFDLPLVKMQSGHKNRQSIWRRTDTGMEAVTCTERWGAYAVHDFSQKQWRVLAPYFNQDEPAKAKHFVFTRDHILPFMAPCPSDKIAGPREGAYGKVYMVHIHPQHHNFCRVGEDDKGFAIKELRQPKEVSGEAFEREVRALRKFSGAVEHDHVVTLLATYEQSGRFFLVFPRGQGHLFDCWKTRNHDGSHDDVLWVARQCEGLAEALVELHHWGTSKAHTFSTPNDCIECRTDHAIVPHERHLRRRLRSPSRYSTSESGQPVHPQLRSAKTDEPTHIRTCRRWTSTMFDGRRTRSESIHEPLGNRFRGRSPVADILSHPGSPVVQPRPDSHQFLKRKDFGRHGDIKPQNIIWYRHRPGHRGILKLADFGQAELNSKWTKTSDREVAFSRTHRPPECDLTPLLIGQDYDIWSLGCVFLEFVTWAIGGSKLVYEFGVRRMARDPRIGIATDAFFDILPPNGGEPKAVVKCAVVQFIQRLREAENCGDYFQDLLNLVEQHMLVVNRKDRWDSDKVHSRLDDMLDTCSGDSGWVYTTQKSA